MKQSYRYILSLILLLTLIGQLVVVSSSYFFSDENLEENIEMKAEDIFDDEIEDVKFCYFDWLKRTTLQYGSFDLFDKSTRYVLREYSKIDKSILVPPPEMV